VKRLDYYWYRQSPWLLFLWPISLLFCLLVVIRRWLYRQGWLKAYSPPVPLIVVGNVTVGGSGKTPLVLWLAEMLKQHGYRPGLVSRGYGGQATGWPQDVDAQSDPQWVGDEAAMLAARSGCPMMVGPDRVAAVERLLALHDVDVIISDDGMQHYRMGRDIEIAVLDGERRLGNRLCLPAGPLREPAFRLKQVDFIVTNGHAADSNEWAMTLLGDSALPLKGRECRSLHSFSDSPLHAVAGIGNPERFFTSLRQLGLDVKTHPFSDHYPYQSHDLDFGDNQPVLMTEKDAVKYRKFADSRHWYVPVTASLPEAFGNSILAALEKSNG